MAKQTAEAHNKTYQDIFAGDFPSCILLPYSDGLVSGACQNTKWAPCHTSYLHDKLALEGFWANSMYLKSRKA